jgi:hypothetical protein
VVGAGKGRKREAGKGRRRDKRVAASRRGDGGGGEGAGGVGVGGQGERGDGAVGVGVAAKRVAACRGLISVRKSAVKSAANSTRSAAPVRPCAPSPFWRCCGSSSPTMVLDCPRPLGRARTRTHTRTHTRAHTRTHTRARTRAHARTHLLACLLAFAFLVLMD